ncbi:MAG: carbon-nitrogen hydrolase family protein [Mycobacteriaceae bacterium]
MVVAAAQIAPAAGQIHQNALAVSQYIRAATARGARLVLFPELCLGGYDLALLAEAGTWTVEGDVRLETTREACAEPGVHAVVGTAHVAGGGRRLLASVMVHPDGSEVVQGKQHLHGRETDWFTADRSPTRLFVVDEWRVALAVCYDAAVPARPKQPARRGLTSLPCQPCTPPARNDAFRLTWPPEPRTIACTSFWRTWPVMDLAGPVAA